VSNYVLIDSRGPFENADLEHVPRLAEQLASAGHSVIVFLLQNGVLGARPGSRVASYLAHLGKHRVQVLADDDALKERAVAKLTDGVRRSNLDELVGLLMERPTRVLWH
jgi:sulfur relay (sulfurtransferase) complex TusBCD TusD component (DsrE family)